MLNISEPSNKKIALFELGFRPFFMLAAFFASFFIAGWYLFYSAKTSADIINYYSALTWHSHEMVFAYTGAVIAGFLLTAVTNWTGRMTLKNWSLAGLVLLWILGRILPFTTSMGWFIATIDLVFYPYLMLAVAIPIIKTGNWRNLFILGILVLLFLANLLVHLELLKVTSSTLKVGIYAGLYLEFLLIIIFAGRVFPFFTGRGVATPFEPSKKQWLEVASVISFILFAFADLLKASPFLSLTIASLVVILHVWRLSGWYHSQIWKVPLLWILHLGYFFLIIGVLLRGLASFWPVMTFPALHAMTIGGIGLITLGMMARVSLGHTGRNIHQPPKSITGIFILGALSCLIRVIMPLVTPHFYIEAIMLSSVLWSLAFLWFAIVYFPYWIAPRVDGRPG